MPVVKLCGTCAKKFRVKEGVRLKRVIGTKECIFNQPFITSAEVGELIEVIA